MLEVGLFIGTLGRERTFLLPTSREMRLPSDVLGLTTLPYRHRTDGNLRAAVNSAATSIVERIRTLGHQTLSAVQPESPEPASTPSAPQNLDAPFRAGDGAVANRVAMGEAVSAIAAKLGVLRHEAFWAVERLKEELGVASHAELEPILRDAGFGATKKNEEPWDGLLLSLRADRSLKGEIPRQPGQSLPGGGAMHADAAALGMEIEQLCTNARAQGWIVKTNNETTLKLIPPGVGRKTHTLRKSTPKKTRAQLRRFAAELAADGLRVNVAIAGPVEDSPF